LCLLLFVFVLFKCIWINIKWFWTNKTPWLLNKFVCNVLVELEVILGVGCNNLIIVLFWLLFCFISHISVAWLLGLLIPWFEGCFGFKGLWAFCCLLEWMHVDSRVFSFHILSNKRKPTIFCTKDEGFYLWLCWVENL